jgi:hypothetical protein
MRGHRAVTIDDDDRCCRGGQELIEGASMVWNEEVQAALRAWLAPSTAHTEHPLDDARFYNFIAQVWRARQGIWDETVAKERMSAAARDLHPDWPADLVSKLVETRRQQGTLILNFLASLREQGGLDTLAT